MNTENIYFRITIFGVIIYSIYLVYQPGVTGGLFYDDFVNLGRLEQIQGFSSMLDFVFGGTAGPTGRPIALATFLPHAHGWPENIASILEVNVIIHLFNGILLLILGNLILQIHGQFSKPRCFWIALSAASLWLAMPLLASTNLIAVQRMTSLSAFFGLIGLIGFVFGYRYEQTDSKKAFIIQFFSLGVGTVFATLAKENGALFPIYALIIDAFLIKSLAAPLWLRRIRQIPLWIALFIVIIFLSPLMRDWTETNAFLGWSPIERLTTQIVLLWQYVGLALAPQPTAFGPFYDDIKIITGWPVFLFICLFAIWMSIGFFVRKKSPWILFSLLWFLAGHLLESTVLNLELFFEHRNYLPVFGICFGLAALAWSLPGSLSKWGPALFFGYFFLQTTVLYGLTTIWGNPLEAGENWLKRHPSSSRAILHLSADYYEAYGNPSYALPFIDHALKNCLDCTDVQMQGLMYSCGFEQPDQIEQRFYDLEKTAVTGRASVALLDSIHVFHNLEQGKCPPLEDKDFFRLVQNILKNPNFSAKEYQVHALYHAAFFSEKLGLDAMALEYLEQAESLAPQVMPILQIQIKLLTNLNLHKQALDAIERRRNLANRNETMTDKDLDKMVAEVMRGKDAGVKLFSEMTAPPIVSPLDPD